MYPPGRLTTMNLAELQWLFLFILFGIINDRDRQESGRKEREMKKEIKRMEERIRVLEGEKREWEAWKEDEAKRKEEDAKQMKEHEEERKEWAAWKEAAEEREESHHHQLAVSHQKTSNARLRADHAESTLRSTKLSFELEREEWEEEKRRLVGDLKKVRRENKGIVYLRAKIARAEAGLRFWEREYGGKDTSGFEGSKGLAPIEVGRGEA